MDYCTEIVFDVNRNKSLRRMEIGQKFSPGIYLYSKQDQGQTVQESVFPKQQQYRFVLVDTWWYRVSMECYWLVLGGTGSVEGGTD